MGRKRLPVHAGYWGPRVGFYSGVNYGYGYFGTGFVGGEWRANRFYYNTAVTRVNNVRITNVYVNKTVIRNETVNRVSYNGGRGGIDRRPDRDEEMAGRERHIDPTPVQVKHRDEAERNRDLWAKNNHGKPSIAATERPGEFRGNVVRAKAAGGEWRAPENRGGNRPENRAAENRGGENRGPNRPENRGNDNRGMNREVPRPNAERENRPANRPENRVELPENRGGRPDNARPDNARPDNARPENRAPENRSMENRGGRPDNARPENRAPENRNMENRGGGRPEPRGEANRPNQERGGHENAPKNEKNNEKGDNGHKPH